MKEPSKEIIEKLEEVEEKLKSITHSKPYYSTVLEEYSKLLNELKTLKMPSIYTRETVDRYIELYSRVVDTLHVLDQIGELTLEEISTVLDELIQSLKRFIDVLKYARRREVFVMSLPLYTALMIYVLNLFIYLFEEPVMTLPTLFMALAALIAVYLSKYRLDLSYIVIMLAALTGIASTILLSTNTQYDQYVLIVHVLILVTAMTYFQTARTIRSRTYREKVYDALKSLRQLADELRKKPTTTDPLKLNELEERAKSIFRKLYGEYGDKLLSYKVNILVMHGMKKEEALKKIISMYSEILKS